MKTNFLKLGLAFAAILAFSFGNAQQTTGNIAQQGQADPGSESTGTSVRVIDNKGTIKYLQATNGITMFTNDNSGDVTTTTWQLGGTLTSNTSIDVNGQVFAIDGIDIATAGPATTIADGSVGDPTATETGYALLVRDEATGETQKILVTDLIESGHEVLAGVTTGTTSYDLATSTVDLGDFSRVWVYRNGAKLVANVDYQITDADTIQFNEVATGPSSWSIITGDVIEVQYFK